MQSCCCLIGLGLGLILLVLVLVLILQFWSCFHHWFRAYMHYFTRNAFGGLAGTVTDRGIFITLQLPEFAERGLLAKQKSKWKRNGWTEEARRDESTRIGLYYLWQYLIKISYSPSSRRKCAKFALVGLWDLPMLHGYRMGSIRSWLERGMCHSQPRSTSVAYRTPPQTEPRLHQ